MNELIKHAGTIGLNNFAEYIRVCALFDLLYYCIFLGITFFVCKFAYKQATGDDPYSDVSKGSQMAAVTLLVIGFVWSLTISTTFGQIFNPIGYFVASRTQILM